jgi:hypothetical protein
MAPNREKSNCYDPWYAKVAFGLVSVLLLQDIRFWGAKSK